VAGKGGRKVGTRELDGRERVRGVRTRENERETSEISAYTHNALSHI
jgi:hypothetical protein